MPGRDDSVASRNLEEKGFIRGQVEAIRRPGQDADVVPVGGRGAGDIPRGDAIVVADAAPGPLHPVLDRGRHPVPGDRRPRRPQYGIPWGEQQRGERIVSVGSPDLPLERQ